MCPAQGTHSVLLEESAAPYITRLSTSIFTRALHFLPSYYLLSTDVSKPADLHPALHCTESVTLEAGCPQRMLSVPCQTPGTGWGTRPPGSGVLAATAHSRLFPNSGPWPVAEELPSFSKVGLTLWCCWSPELRQGSGGLKLLVTKLRTHESSSLFLFLGDPA